MFKPFFYFWNLEKLKFEPKLILASKSPRRIELIKHITNDFTVFNSNVTEIVPNGIESKDIPILLAKQKAQAVADKFPDNTVLGCDTVVVLNNEVLGKPKTKQEAYNMLKALSGNAHEVITGCCIKRRTDEQTFSVTSRVWFKKLSDNQITAYINTGEPFDKAGSYGIQSKGGELVQKIEGDYYNIVGLPVKAVYNALKY